jgi:SAM-dependent methyltransferase
MPDGQKRALATALDPAFGFRHLNPMPARTDVHAFFAEEYYVLIADGRKAADIARALHGGAAAERQRQWLRATLHADIAETIATHAHGRRVLEIGCGLGDLLLDLQAKGFTGEGIEISPIAADEARKRGVAVHQGAFEDLADAALKNERFDAILFINVLEQMHDAPAVLTRAAALLAPGGIVIVRSGNDFNPLQLALRDQMDKPEYWVVEDHVYYFDYGSIGRVMEAAGLRVVDQQSDFPMELFPLLGFDYVAQPEIGGDCHARRMQFEENLPQATRRALYRAFAAAGMGRCVFVVGRKV